MSKIQIIVGTMMGTAKEVAEHLQNAIATDHQVSINMNANTDDLTRDNDELLLFCTSNTGNGDLPDNIVPLFIQLINEFPNIANRRYALINIGSRSYRTFGEAGRKLDAALQDIGAIPVTDMLLIDSDDGSDIKETALQWAKEIVKQ